MKNLILCIFMVSCNSINPWFATNIDEGVAEKFSCHLYELTVQGKLVWEIDLDDDDFSIKYKGEWIYVDAEKLFVNIGGLNRIPFTYIKNSCQSKLYKLLDNKHKKVREKIIKEVRKNYFDKVLDN